ncbi:hypothetical protein [Streptomyces mirabilis]|uniref:hypothetical protein n=1 Tax=Streptomyces mirabilis TaxID=68239 RepID=UPI003684D705
MLLFARALKGRGVPVPEIAKKLTVKTGKNAGQHPSVASVYRALAEAEAAEAPAGPEIIAPRRPTRVDFTGPGSGTDPELMERLTRQVLGPGAGEGVRVPGILGVRGRQPVRESPNHRATRTGCERSPCL